MVNKKTICKRIGVELPEKHIIKTSARYIHKHIFHKKCPAVMDRMIIPKRDATIIYMKKPQLGVYPASLDKLVQLYNSMPLKLKAMKPPKLKKHFVKNDLE